MRRLAILHFSPIERYPPVLNLLNFLAQQTDEDIEVRVYTMRVHDKSRLFIPSGKRIRIDRFGRAGKKNVRAYLNYLLYYACTLFHLIWRRPDTVLYYETLSCFPAFIFKKYIRKNSGLFIHYHEYTSPKEYEQGMVLGKWLHSLEKKIYHLADWISHTNADRIGLFREDMADIALAPLYTLPNYPPAAWGSLASPKVESTSSRKESAASRKDTSVSRNEASVSRNEASVSRNEASSGLPAKIVYVGSLSLDTMYTREMAAWVISQSGRAVWDIYSDNITNEARDYLATLDNTLVRFKGSASYDTLPRILTGYDVGVILYNGHIPNYIYNAPNKLFEYVACGMDVWFPDIMLGCHPYITKDVFPKVMALDFQNLSQWNLSSALDRSGLRYEAPGLYAEGVLPTLLQKMKGSKRLPFVWKKSSTQQ